MHGNFDDITSEQESSLSALFLTEVMSEINEGASFLDRLNLDEIDMLRRVSIPMKFQAGETIFLQGDPHKGIYIIDSGRVKTFYAAPSGKEITLAFWTHGHFVGGPEVFGGGSHMWSSCAVETSRLSYLPGSSLRNLVMTNPNFALCLIEGLVAKGKCYSALVQMLGTRSVVERLAQLLLILSEVDNSSCSLQPKIDRKITHEQLANIVGSTRQWVTNALSRFQKKGLISIDRKSIIILNPDALMHEA